MSSEEETLEFIEQSLDTIKGLEKQKEELTAKVAELEEVKVTLEKVASEASEGLSSGRVKSVVSGLVKLSYINPLYADQVSEKINSDPNVVLDLLEKISEASVALPSSGRGIAKEASEQESTDPDGWLSLGRVNRKY